MADPVPQPYWPWCAMPGASRNTKLTVDEVAFGDGYKHRAIRGLNPARPSWSLSFPFTSMAELQERDDFLKAHAARGFWMTPPDGTGVVLVTADEWTAQISEKNRQTGIVGLLSVMLTRSFNPQPNPITP